MEALSEWIIQHAHLAHYFIFGAILLAGLNIPISADLMVIISAVLAATVIPENTIPLFLSIFLGCYFSAWIAFWVGRKLGARLSRFSFFAKIFPPERLEKVKHFYEKYGIWTLIIGRFIPFGVRNCIFMTSGMSKMHFGTFVIRDIFACFIWSSTTFYLFYSLGQNYQLLYQYAKTFNLLIFVTFSMAVIIWIWYKVRKKKRSQRADKTI